MITIGLICISLAAVYYEVLATVLMVACYVYTKTTYDPTDRLTVEETLVRFYRILHPGIWRIGYAFEYVVDKITLRGACDE